MGRLVFEELDGEGSMGLTASHPCERHLSEGCMASSGLL